jgi:hypothetical protein
MNGSHITLSGLGHRFPDREPAPNWEDVTASGSEVFSPEPEDSTLPGIAFGFGQDRSGLPSRPMAGPREIPGLDVEDGLAALRIAHGASDAWRAGIDACMGRVAMAGAGQDRMALIRAIGGLCEEAQGRGGILEAHALVVDRVLNERDPEIRGMAASKLLALRQDALAGGAHAADLGPLDMAIEAAVKDEDSLVKIAVADAITVSHPPPAGILEALAADPDPRVRAAAARAALGLVDRGDEAVAQAAWTALSGPIDCLRADLAGAAEGAENPALDLLFAAAAKGLPFTPDQEALLAGTDPAGLRDDPTWVMGVARLVAAKGDRALLATLGEVAETPGPAQEAALKALQDLAIAMDGDAAALALDAHRLLEGVHPEAAAYGLDAIGERLLAAAQAGNKDGMAKAFNDLRERDGAVALTWIRRVLAANPNSEAVRDMAVAASAEMRAFDSGLSADLSAAVDHDAVQAAGSGPEDSPRRQRVARLAAANAARIEKEWAALNAYLAEPRVTVDLAAQDEDRRRREALEVATAAAIKATHAARTIEEDNYRLGETLRRIVAAMDYRPLSRDGKRAKANLSQRQVLFLGPVTIDDAAFVSTPDESIDAQRFWADVLSQSLDRNPQVSLSMELALVEARLEGGLAKDGLVRTELEGWLEAHAVDHPGILRLATSELEGALRGEATALSSSACMRAVASAAKAGVATGIGGPDLPALLAKAATERPGDVDETLVSEIYSHGGAALASGGFMKVMDGPNAQERQRSVLAAVAIAKGLIRAHESGDRKWWGPAPERAMNASRQVVATALLDPNPAVRLAAERAHATFPEGWRWARG